MSKKFKRVLDYGRWHGRTCVPRLGCRRYLREKNIEVHWLGTSKAWNRDWSQKQIFHCILLTISGLRGKGIKTLLAAPLKVTKAISQSMQVIKQINPDVVIGMGGFVSGPGGVASWLTRQPLIIHEQNAKAGLTNKILARFSSRILEGFPSAFKPEAKVIDVGNPVRSEIANLPPPQDTITARTRTISLIGVGRQFRCASLK